MMEKLKFALFSVVVLVLLGILGYWAVMTIQSGSQFASTQKIQQLLKDNEDLTKQVANLTDQLNTAQSQIQSATPVAPNPPASSADGAQTSSGSAAPATSKTNSAPAAYKYQSLINQLQSLVAKNVFLKLKSTGTSVGVVQNFLNIYNGTSNKIDNDYGTSTASAISAFQKDEGLSVDGQAGSSTFTKMIAWLKKQG
jgi:murein L,D-transpeptidase YcbB/YkuD